MSNEICEYCGHKIKYHIEENGVFMCHAPELDDDLFKVGKCNCVIKK